MTILNRSSKRYSSYLQLMLETRNTLDLTRIVRMAKFVVNQRSKLLIGDKQVFCIFEGRQGSQVSLFELLKVIGQLDGFC